MPKSSTAATLTCTYNDIEGLKKLFAENKGEIAGVILEPVVGNSGFIPPTMEFLKVRCLLHIHHSTLYRSRNTSTPFLHTPFHPFSQALREVTQEDGALLCFDEVC